MKVKSKALKKNRPNIKNHNCCPNCKLNFAKMRLGRVFKDVLECQDCGAIWVEMDDSVMQRWL